MANLLITGGAGFIGGNFVHYWSQANPDDVLIVLDAFTYAGNRSTIAGVEQAMVVAGDIRDTDLVAQLLSDYEVTTLVHFAAESHVDRSIAGPDAFVETNVVGTHSLLKAARSIWIDQGSGRDHRFHHISTDEVYGSLELAAPAFSETTPFSPNSPYSASKASSDHLVRAYHHTYGLQVTTSNCSNNYGPYQFPEKLIPLMLLNAIHGRPLPVYGDGQNIRDWLHVADHCRAIDACLSRGKVGETYNVGGGAELTNIQVVDAIGEKIDRLFQQDPTLSERFSNAPAAAGKQTAELKTFVADRAGHDLRYAIDSEKISRELSFKPELTFSDGLEITLRWYLENESWWRPLLERNA